MDDKKIGNILEQVVTGDIGKISKSDLEETLHWVSLGDGRGNQTVISTIKLELEKRQKTEELKIAESGVFWQKWGVIISVIISIIALVISIAAYFKQ